MSFPVSETFYSLQWCDCQGFTIFMEIWWRLDGTTESATLWYDTVPCNTRRYDMTPCDMVIYDPIHYNRMKYDMFPYNTIRYCASIGCDIWYNVILYSIIRYNIDTIYRLIWNDATLMLHSNTTLYCSLTQYDAIWYDAVWYEALWCDSTWCNTIWYNAIWYMLQNTNWY